MELGIQDRLALLVVLPHEGSFTNLKIVRQLREELSFNDEENKLLDFKEDGDKLKWDEDAVFSKEVEIGDTARKIIQKALKGASSQEKLPEACMDVYEIFVEE